MERIYDAGVHQVVYILLDSNNFLDSCILGKSCFIKLMLTIFVFIVS